jgi:hypothetical protein
MRDCYDRDRGKITAGQYGFFPEAVKKESIDVTFGQGWSGSGGTL